MQRIIFVLIFLCIFSVNSVFADVEVLNDNNGFRAIVNGQQTIIDQKPRDMVRKKVDFDKNKIIIKYFIDSRIPKNGMVIISDNRVVFDSKRKLEIDCHNYMEKIYKNIIWAADGKGNLYYPHLYGYNSRTGRKFRYEDYTYKADLSSDKIYIDINFQANYQKCVRFVYGFHNFRLLKIVNKSGIVAEDRYPIATINDPDGYTNVRSGPSKKHKIIEKIYDGEIFAVIKWGNWCKIITPTGKIGFIHQSRVKKIKRQ